MAEVHAAMRPSYAFNLLTGHPNLTVDEYRVELKGVTLGDLHEVTHEVMGSALLMVPKGSRGGLGGFRRGAHPVDGSHRRHGARGTGLRTATASCGWAWTG